MRLSIMAALQVFALLAFVTTASAQDVPAGAAGVLARAFPSTEVWATAVGDLDNDGINDLVAVVAKTATDDDDLVQRIVVLKGLPQSKYRVWSQTDMLPRFRKGGPSIEVRRGSLFVDSMNSPRDVAETQSLQFKYMKQQFRLIGVNRKVFSIGKESDTDREVSFNVLTGDKTETLQIRNRTKRVKSKLPAGASDVLEGFDLELSRSLNEAVQYRLPGPFPD